MTPVPERVIFFRECRARAARSSVLERLGASGTARVARFGGMGRAAPPEQERRMNSSTEPQLDSLAEALGLGQFGVALIDAAAGCEAPPRRAQRLAAA